MFRSLLATLVVAMCCSNAAFAQVTAVDKAKADANAVAQVVAEARSAIYSAEADLKSLTKAQKDLSVARKTADPAAEAVVHSAYAALKAAQATQSTTPNPQNEKAELDAAESYRKAGSVYDQAKDTLTRLEDSLAKKYKLKKAKLDAGLATKVAQTKKELSVLQATLARNERALTDAKDGVRDARDEMILSLLGALRQEVRAVSANTLRSAVADEEVVAQNKVLLETLKAMHIADEKEASQLANLHTLLEKVVRENPNNPVKQKEANDILREVVPTPLPASPTTYCYPQQQQQAVYTAPCRRCR